MKNRYVAEHIRVYNEIFDYLEKWGLRPAVHKMDNECPQELKDIIVHLKKTDWGLCHPTITAPTQLKSALTLSSVTLFLV